MLSNKRALKVFIEEHVKEGYLQRDEIIQATVYEFRSEFGGKDFENAVSATVDRYLARYLISESSWIAPTDCDKLDLAFGQLEIMGIVARQNFCCCNDCGHKEMQAELRRLRAKKRPIASQSGDLEVSAETRPLNRRSKLLKGFAFFHKQDTDRVIKNGTLFLTFDSIEKNIDKAVEVGATIVDVLKKSGLVVTWNGSYLQRIAITDMSWRKRRFSMLKPG